MDRIINLVRWLFFRLRYRRFIIACPRTVVLGKSVSIHSHAKHGTVTINKRVTICDGVLFETGVNGSIDIGENAWISRYTVISAHERIAVGAESMIGEYSSLRDFDHGTSRGEPMQRQAVVSQPIVIGHNVWIGRGVAVLKGVSIGDGAVIGANAVVTRAVPEFSVAVGVPARVTRTR